MPYRAVLTSLFSGLLLLAPTLTQAAMPAPKVSKINDRVYAILGPVGLPSKQNDGYQVNSTLILGDKGAILVDTGATNEVGDLIAKTVAGITPKPVTHVINTHHHGDHYLGNTAFKNAEIIGAKKAQELINETGAEWIAMFETMIGKKLPNTKAIAPKTTFPENTRTERVINGVKLVFWVPKGSHTPGDLLVYLPDDKVLIGGDVLVNHVVPQMRDAHVKSWVGTLDEARKMDFKTVVPGHGPLMTKAEVNKMHATMAKFYQGVEAGYKKGLSDSEVRKTLDLGEWHKLQGTDNIGTNVNRAYLEVEAANF